MFRASRRSLQPNHKPLKKKVLDRIRRTIGEYNFAGQYQQSLAPLGGGLVKAEWFRRYRENKLPERFDRIVQSWDTANKVTELSDFSVCTTWGVKDKNLFLIGVFRRQLEYPALKRAVREQQEAVRCDRSAYRGQGLRHPADPGADHRRLLRCHPLPADRRQDHALARSDRVNRERLCPHSRGRPVARRISPRDDGVPERQA